MTAFHRGAPPGLFITLTVVALVGSDAARAQAVMPAPPSHPHAMAA
jgi:hypothetical protein